MASVFELLRQQLQRDGINFQLQRTAVALQQLDFVVRAVVLAMLQLNLQHLPLKAGCQTGQDVLNALLIIVFGGSGMFSIALNVKHAGPSS